MYLGITNAELGLWSTNTPGHAHPDLQLLTQTSSSCYAGGITPLSPSQPCSRAPEPWKPQLNQPRFLVLQFLTSSVKLRSRAVHQPKLQPCCSRLPFLQSYCSDQACSSAQLLLERETTTDAEKIWWGFRKPDRAYFFISFVKLHFPSPEHCTVDWTG